MNVVGDVLQAYSQCRSVIGAELAGLEFVNQLLKCFKCLTDLELKVFDVQRECGAAGDHWIRYVGINPEAQ